VAERGGGFFPTPGDKGRAEKTLRLKGVVEKVIFANPESLFTVAELKTERGLVVAVGSLGRLHQGERLELTGSFGSHPVHGRRFQVSSMTVIPPQGEEGVKAFLGSGLIPGIGPATAGLIVASFGEQALEVIRESPERLLEIKGIGPKTLTRIKSGLEEKWELEGLALFLQSHGLPPSLTVRLFKRYGGQALAKVRQDPYLLAREVAGIGFRKADEVALKLGHGADSEERLAAGLIQILSEAAGQGHVYLPYRKLIDRTAGLLAVDRELVKARLAELVAQGRLGVEDMNQDLDRFQANQKAIYLPVLLRAEKQVAANLNQLLVEKRPLSQERIKADLSRVEKELELRLAPAQREALTRALAEKVLVITGGPGTGKTTLVRALVQLLQGRGLSLALAAPTGRAAKRLGQAAGREAMTIHRLLEYSPQEGFKRHRGNLLPLAAVIVDEVSMVDLRLMAALVQALDTRARLVLVGDADQLPAVGPGQVLGDLIDSGRLGVVRLSQVFRQAGGSGIVANAHLIRQGRPLPHEDLDDFYFIQQEDPGKAGELIVRLAAERIPERFGLDPFTQVQVLAPMRRGTCGVEALNQRLREALNPLGRPLAGSGFRLGDKVIQTWNNYERMVFNGDLGRIVKELPSGEILVDLEGEPKVYGRGELDELAPAYCLSIHKSQGSEYPAVVVPILAEHTIMLRRNLIYTAVTRAKGLVVLVGSRRALERALAHGGQDRRRSLLARRLREGWG